MACLNVSTMFMARY